MSEAEEGEDEEIPDEISRLLGGNPYFLNIQHGGRASRGGRSPVNESSDESQALIKLKRTTSLCHGQLYQKRMKQAFNKKVHPVKETLCKNILSFQPDSRGKWTPNYEGPYIVKRAFSGGASTLATMDGDELARLVNTNAVKEYFV
ncbi:hypothetical protein MTR_1g027810 [Medicago truncatula]|uniref:Uncharacterized protein n=1 Tax=Medicago truncatula TaxID=3880 RepID=A0A072VQI1_MEDTR|nr:hypothetical protein MTR_1g027810 [Medicago truncatula]